MIIPTTLDGKPFEGMALVILAMQIISLRIELQGTGDGGLLGNFFAFLLPSISFVLLGMQKIAELKTYLLVCSVWGAIVFLGFIVMQDTTSAFRAAIGLGTGIAAYFLIDTQYDTAVWVFFASSLFSLIYTLFVVGPAKNSMMNPAVVKEFREAYKFFPPGVKTQERERMVEAKLKEVLMMPKKEGERELTRMIGIANDTIGAANLADDLTRSKGQERVRQLAILRSAMHGRPP